MNNYLSKKIAFFHLLGVFIVLYIHGFLPNIEHSPFNDVQDFIANVICRGFHPMYFSIAGYLFFFNLKEGKIVEFIGKLKKRFRGLLIPYVMCNILGAAFILIVHSCGLPSTNVDNAVNYYHTHNFLLFLFYLPALGQLWFVRDLIFIVMLSYPLYFAIKKTGLMGILAFGSAILYFGLNGFPLSIFAFSVGAYFAIKQIDVTCVKCEKLIYSLGAAYLTIFGFIEKDIPYCFGAISAFCLFFAMWALYDRMFHIIKFVNRGGDGFFVYIFHDPLMSIIKWLLQPYYERCVILQVVTYISLPIIIYVTLSFIASGMKKYIPFVYSILTGGR